MARHASLAEHYRAHREAFTLALELGCTPKEAELQIERRKRQECRARLEAKLNAPIVPGMPELIRGAHDGDERPAPYWQRD